MTQSNSKTLSYHVEDAVQRYFKNMEDVKFCGLYDKVLAEVEKPLLKVVMDKVDGNQSEAAKLLGINRNTLRKKLKTYSMLD